jgi:hypothetical protein
VPQKGDADHRKSRCHPWTLLALADKIGIQAEDGRVALLPLYDLEEMMRCE